MCKKIIHIGANKTASTTLQRHLFAKSRQIIYIGEDCKDYDRYKNSILSLISDDDIHFDSSSASSIFENAAKTAGGKTLVFSSEDIMTSHVPSVCAQRLSKFLPDAEILLVIRNQLTAVPSMYANHGAYLRNVPRRYWRRYVSFDEWMEHSIEFIKYSLLGSFFYYRILQAFTPYFSKDKIHILFYEDLLSNPFKFGDDLCRILSIPPEETVNFIGSKRERRRNSRRQLRYHRLCEYFGGKDFIRCLPGMLIKDRFKSYLEGGPPADGFMTDYWKNTIVELFSKDNALLSAEYKIDLKKHHYPMT